MNKRKIRQGDIYFARLPAEKGSVQSGTRPVLITQCNWLNKTSPTVLVATVTSKLKRLDIAEHVLLPKLKGLPKQSMVETEQRRTLDKSELLQYLCTVDPVTMKRISRALRLSEDMEKHKRQFKKQTHRGGR